MGVGGGCLQVLNPLSVTISVSTDMLREWVGGCLQVLNPLSVTISVSGKNLLLRIYDPFE